MHGNIDMYIDIWWVCILQVIRWKQERPYSNENTASRLLSEVKHCLVQLVLRWGTTLESWMLFFCFSYLHNKNRRITSLLLLLTTLTWLPVPRRNRTRSSFAFLIVDCDTTSNLHFLASQNERRNSVLRDSSDALVRSRLVITIRLMKKSALALLEE